MFIIEVLDEKLKHALIFAQMVFPTTKTMKEKPENAVLQTEYTCSSNQCNFQSAITDISNNDVLKTRWKSSNLCIQVVKDIESNQDDYLPFKIDGFYMNRMGHQLVYMKRVKSPEEKQSDTSMTGFIEISGLRRHLLID